MLSSPPKGSNAPARALRTVVGLTIAALLGSVLAQAYVDATPTALNEAPGLAQRVAAGTLPPLAERLPERPVVVEPFAEIGTYGGTWRTAILEPADTWMRHVVGYDHLVTWLPDWTGTQANVIESVEVNDDATVYTFGLRRGLKWSDGEPYTADDLVFVYESVWSHPELPGFPASMRSPDGHGVIEKVDDDTVTVTFPSSFGLFLEGIADSFGIEFTQYPAHYMAQFHPDHNPDGLDALVTAARLGSWVDLFEIRGDTWRNTEKPSLNAWLITEGFGEGTRVVAERNPYYWKVDTDGNQLPYIDRIVFNVYTDTEVMLLQALGGEIDMVGRHINSIANLPVLADAGDQHGFDIYRMIPSDANDFAITFNLNHEDETTRALYNDKNFRIGVSHAINRQEINDLMFAGTQEIQQPSVLPNFPELYNERLAKQYIEYDTDLANEYLDRAGLTERDAQGFRLDTGGRRVSFTIIGRADQDFTVDGLPIIVRYWQAVGLDAQVRIVDRTLFRQIRETTDFDVMTDSGGRASLQDVFADNGVRYWLPTNNGSIFAPLWYNWYLGRQPQETPPDDVLHQFDLWAQIKATADVERRFELMRQILDIAADQFFVVGIGAPTIDYGIVSDRFGNVPEEMPGSFLYAAPGPTMPFQYFLRSE
ncbi:MAG: ABC transporter substrate-binding protein [Trueperaceae bacterium]|nr:ABC transporter substrate-binding protein [Trueperaceae bacterium]